MENTEASVIKQKEQTGKKTELMYPPKKRKLSYPDLAEKRLSQNPELNEQERKELELIRSHLDKLDEPLMKKEEEGLMFPSGRANSLYHARNAGKTPLSDLITYIDKGLEVNKNVQEVRSGILPADIKTTQELLGFDIDDLTFGESHTYDWGTGSITTHLQEQYSEPVQIKVPNLPEDSKYKLKCIVTKTNTHGGRKDKHTTKLVLFSE